MTIPFSVKATGEVEQRSLGEFSYVKIISASLPFQISFDGNTFQAVNQNDYLQTSAPRTNVFCRALNGQASAFTIKVSKSPFTGQDTTQSNAPTSLIGNLGIADNAAAAGGLPACDGNGYLQVTAGMALLIPGNNNGHRRQSVTFTVSAASAVALRVNDSNGAGHMIIALGEKIQLVTDGDLRIGGVGGTCSFMVGQIFLNN